MSDEQWKARRREVSITNDMHECRHYRRGAPGESYCELGVKLRDVATDGRVEWKDGQTPALPCHGPWTHEKGIGTIINAPIVDSCSQRSLLTREEAEARVAADDLRWSHMGAARHAIVDHSKLRKVNRQWQAERRSGSVPCPACGGTLGYSASTYNGHVHAKCSTAGCLAWME